MPAEVSELLNPILVPSTVTGYLIFPKIGIGLWSTTPPVAHLAAVPKTPMNKDNELVLW